MSAYVLTLLSASVAVCIIELLLPRGDGGRMASHLRLVSGLFLLVLLLNPLREGLLFLRSAATGELGDLVADRLPSLSYDDVYDDAFAATLAEMGRQEVEARVTETLEIVFAIPAEGCAVEAVCKTTDDTEGTSLTLRELRIGLRGQYALEDPHPIEDYFADRLECPCHVTILP